MSAVLTVDDYRQLFLSQQQAQRGLGYNRYRIDPFQFQQIQHGEGIGTFFVNLLRSQILPLVPSLLKNSAGLALGVANSLVNNADNEKVSSILKRHGKKALKNMASDTLDHVGKQIGRGKKRGRSNCNSSSSSNRRQQKTKTKKKSRKLVYY